MEPRATDVNGVRAGVAERRNTDTRDYKILMDVAGDSLDYAIRPARLRGVAATLASSLSLARPPDAIIGLAPGGIPIALAVGFELDRPVVVAYKTRLGLEHELTWSEPHCENATFYLYGFPPGSAVVLVDDEIDSGNTLVNAVAALRAAGVDVLAVGAAIESRHEGRSLGREGLAALGIDLVAVRHLDVAASLTPSASAG